MSQEAADKFVESVLDDLMKDVTRVVIINHTGRNEIHPQGTVLEMWDVWTELSLQDDGRTLKVYINQDFKENGN